MDIDMSSIGNRIKKRRNELGLTQTDIYNECGVDSGALSKIENGSRNPSVTLFYKISQVLKCDMEWLITGNSAHMQNSIICSKEEELLNEFRKLSNEDQEELFEILKIKIRKTQKSRKATSSNSTGISNEDMAG